MPELPSPDISARDRNYTDLAFDRGKRAKHDYTTDLQLSRNRGHAALAMGLAGVFGLLSLPVLFQLNAKKVRDNAVLLSGDEFMSQLKEPRHFYINRADGTRVESQYAIVPGFVTIHSERAATGTPSDAFLTRVLVFEPASTNALPERSPETDFQRRFREWEERKNAEKGIVTTQAVPHSPVIYLVREENEVAEFAHGAVVTRGERTPVLTMVSKSGNNFRTITNQVPGETSTGTTSYCFRALQIEYWAQPSK